MIDSNKHRDYSTMHFRLDQQQNDIEARQRVRRYLKEVSLNDFMMYFIATSITES